MTRIKIEDGIPEVIMKLGEGNPGAYRALMVLAKETPGIEPDSVLGPFGPLLMLDQFGIYGTDIYILYNDKCNCDIRRFLLLIRATQCGKFEQSDLVELSKDQCGELNVTNEEWDRLEKWIAAYLPNFGGSQ